MVPVIPDSAPPEVLAFNAEVAAFMADLPPIREAGLQAARLAREEGRSVFGPLWESDLARPMSIEGPGGQLGLRVLAVDRPRGVFLHIHGGGWVLGRAHHHDRMLERLAIETHQTVVSVDYRLAPEHPYPAAPDDCEAAARWLVDHGPGVFGTDCLTIGGESVGAHLAVVTLLRMRNARLAAPFRAANLVYGIYDLRLTPGVRAYGSRPTILDGPGMAWFVEQYAAQDLEDPDVSPIFADLGGMPPALFTVGDDDPLIDDSVFMAGRWRAAGIESRLDLWPGAVHAFDYFDTRYARDARARMHAFLGGFLDAG
jgi:acetyl esterase